MSTLRYTDGDVTVTLDSGLEDFVRKAVAAAGGETLKIVQRLAEETRAEAANGWYAPGTGVTRRTGKSGQIDVVERVSAAEVRVSVGTVDLQKAKYVHRPGPLSTTVEEITESEYWREREGPAASLVFRAKRDRAPNVKSGLWYRIISNPEANDGKYLLAELIRKPGNKRIKAALPEIGRAIANKVGA